MASQPIRKSFNPNRCLSNRAQREPNCARRFIRTINETKPATKKTNGQGINDQNLKKNKKTFFSYTTEEDTLLMRHTNVGIKYAQVNRSLTSIPVCVYVKQSHRATCI